MVLNVHNNYITIVKVEFLYFERRKLKTARIVEVLLLLISFRIIENMSLNITRLHNRHVSVKWKNQKLVFVVICSKRPVTRNIEFNNDINNITAVYHH